MYTMNNKLKSLLALASLIDDRDEPENDMPSKCSSVTDPFIGLYCVVRTRDAGVHVGTVASIDGLSTVLRDARRLWKWAGAFTLNEVALDGINSKNSRMSANVSSILLTESIEIIPVANIAKTTMDNCNES